MLYVQLYDMQHIVGILILCQSGKMENICILTFRIQSAPPLQLCYDPNKGMNINSSG